MATKHKNKINELLIFLGRSYSGLRAWEIDTGQAYTLFSVKDALQEYKRTGSITMAMKKLGRISYGKKGHPDITGLYHGIWFGIEVKVGKDKQREDQSNFQKMIEAAGGIYILFDGNKDIGDQLKKLDQVKEWANGRN